MTTATDTLAARAAAQLARFQQEEALQLAADRQRVALQSLGLSLDPEAPASLSAITWAVIHAVAVECGRKHDDACAIADRWATVADIAGGSPASTPSTDHQ